MYLPIPAGAGKPLLDKMRESIMPKIRCAIYDRVSTEIQAKEGLSLDAQKQALTDYAISHGYEIVGYYADEGLTARKKMQNRKDQIGRASCRERV